MLHGTLIALEMGRSQHLAGCLRWTWRRSLPPSTSRMLTTAGSSHGDAHQAVTELGEGGGFHRLL